MANWKGLLAASFVGAVAAWLWAVLATDAAQATLIRNSSVENSHSLATTLNLLRSPELLNQIAPELSHHARAEAAGPDLIELTITGKGRNQNETLADLYSQVAVEKLESLQREEGRTILLGIESRLTKVQEDFQVANQQLAAFQSASGIYDLDGETSALVKQVADLELKRQDAELQLASVERQIQSVQAALADHHPALLAARQTLDRALLRYTDEHPRVQELRANVGSIRTRLLVETNQVDPEVALSTSSLARDLYAQFIGLRTRRANLGSQAGHIAILRQQLNQKLEALPNKRLEYAKLSAAYQSLKQTHEQVMQQRQAAEASARSALAPFRLYAPARTLAVPFRWLYPLSGALLGLTMAGVFTSARQLCRRRIESEADLERATQLPVLAALGDLNRMTAREQEQWAFTTFAHLKGSLMSHDTQTLMCGFISSRHGEGRSTCIHLLADAAAKQGYRTRVVTTNRATTTAGLLAAPADIPEALASASHAPLAIPLPGWVWNKDLREQWQVALNEIKTVSNLVTFIELPPACEPEGMLLAEKFSPLIWIGARNRANIRETRSQMEVLRSCGARLAGALFNNPSAAKRWLAGLLLVSTLQLQGQTPVPPAVQEQPPVSLTNAFSVVSPTQLADWQKRLTLGPGDVLNIGLFEQPESVRNGITVAPDGSINYLQARDVQAAGLTVDELREKLEQVLLKFYRPPLRVLVHPQTYFSKKFYMLGNVNTKGVFAMDRPITLLEALARARGFARNPQQTPASRVAADLSRSFLVRRQAGGEYRRVPVDFEALFQRADLAQNLVLAPDDYVYFPPLDLQEVYVLGEVARPGPVQLIPELSVTKGIALRGGFTRRSYRTQVLVVRGSLKNPQTFVVNVSDVLSAKATDLKLQARDIVYVSRTPWYRAEELLEGAILSFVSSMAVTAAGADVGPIITSPWF